MKIAILMSTFNGQKYLAEQIGSILNQRLPDNYSLFLYIRDDGSSDQTVQIIKDFEARYSNIIFTNSGNDKNIGYRDSFLKLLQNVYDNDPKTDFFAFSDQDDYWMEDKLSVALEKLNKSTNAKGAFYYSNKYATDEDLNIVEQNQIEYYGDFIEALWSSMAFGCTIVFNRKLAGYISGYIPKMTYYHDSWVYHVAKCIGSDIYFDEKAYILYRQHSDNAVGEKYCRAHNTQPGYLTRHFISNILKPREHVHQKQIEEIASVYSDVLDPEALPYISAVINYTRDFKSKLFLIRAPEMKKRPLLTRLIWIYKLLFNMI